MEGLLDILVKYIENGINILYNYSMDLWLFVCVGNFYRYLIKKCNNDILCSCKFLQ
jgi:hypothetical protein